MKKIVLAAVAGLMLVACGKKSANSDATFNDSIKGTLPIAVVNADTIFSQYTLAVELREGLIKKQEDAKLKVNEKARKLQNEMVEFQRKLENNAFLSRERAEQEGRRLQQREADLQTLDQQLTQEVLEQQQISNKRLRDSINNAIGFVNADGRYELILSTSTLNDNVLYNSPLVDITDQIVEYLNNNYKSK